MSRINPPRTIAVTGATGTLGRPLIAALLARGDRVIALVRDPASAALPAAVDLRRWSASAPQAPLAGADAVVHLAGTPVAPQRWTRRRQALIVASRIDGTRSVVAGIRATPSVKALISASAVEYTGDSGERIVSEDSPPGSGFLSSLVQGWEAEALRAAEHCRVVLLRKGVVLTPSGGMLKTLLPLFRLGLGGMLGSGRQWLPWIHRADDQGLMLAALDHSDFHGPLLCASPNPVRQRDFTFLLADALRRPALTNAPAWALRLALGAMSQVVLASCRPESQRSAELGYAFRFPVLTDALADLVRG